MSRTMTLLLVLIASLVARPVAADDDHGFSKGERFGEQTGEALYRSICQGCHMADGRGAAGAGVYPALAANVRLTNAVYPLAVVLNGRRNMPAFAAVLDDAQVAAVVTYVRSHFGNAYGDVVTAEQVATLRPPSSKSQE